MMLQDQTLAFARSIGQPWKDEFGMDLLGFQQRHLHAQALAAAHTARGYWILHRENQHNECHILARNLLERIFNSRLARKSAKHANELIVSDLTNHIARLKSWQKDEPTPDSVVVELIERLEKELQQFLALLGQKKPRKWDCSQRAAEVGLSWAYRTLYSDFSIYTHAGYQISRPPDLNKPSNLADFIALFAPIDTAIHLHQLSCTDNPCKVAADYKALYDEICSTTGIGCIR